MLQRRTDRLALLQGEEQANESLEEALRDIAEFGVTNIHVMGDERSLSFSYSTGIYDTWGQPEIIMTGFPVNLASAILKDIAARNDDGLFLKLNERTPSLIARGVDCIFREVTPAWRQRLMLRSLWFYGDTPFPVLQCICPDFDNLFPWEPGFDVSWRAKQALLYEGVEQTGAEKGLCNASGTELCN